jgi:hypothetical protein
MLDRTGIGDFRKRRILEVATATELCRSSTNTFPGDNPEMEGSQVILFGESVSLSKEVHKSDSRNDEI